MKRSIPLVLFLACSTSLPTLTDSYGRTIVDLEASYSEDPGAYALGSRSLFRSVDSSRVLSSAPEVLAVERINGRLFEATALSEGESILTYRSDGNEGSAAVQVRRVAALDLPDALAIPGGTLRLPLRGRNGELDLGIRGQASATGEDARVWTPEHGPDEVWSTVPVAETIELNVALETGAGVDTFPVVLPTVAASEVAYIVVERLAYTGVEARAYTAADIQVLGGTYRWTRGGVEISTRDTPSDRVQSNGSDELTQLCAELGARRACLDTYASDFEAI